MEGHRNNFYNEIADQLQCPARALTQEETAARASRIRRKSSKNQPKIHQQIYKNPSKSNQNRSWGRLGASWGLLGPSWGPSWPQDSPKTPQDTQKAFQVTPPWVPRWSQNPPKIDLEAFQKAVIFLIGFGVGFYTHFVPTWLQLGGQNPPKIDPSWIKNRSKIWSRC